jgi:hypothetical protein
MENKKTMKKTYSEYCPSILSDFDAYYFGKVKLFFRKIRVAWLLSWDLLITKDGVYRILKEDKNEMSLYKERFLL